MTYQQFQAEATTPEKTAEFIRYAIRAHEDSEAYKEAVTARRYYDGENVTVSERRNLIYDEKGNAYKDIWSPNHKLKSHFFEAAVNQRVSFLLASGIVFGNPETKDKLSIPGKSIDTQTFIAAQEAYIGGKSYSFFNHDHIEVFSRETYVEIPNARDGAMKAGIRYWRYADDTPLNAYLFEEDGYSVYEENDNKELILTTPKRAYRQRIVKSELTAEVVDGEPYPFLPIVPLAINRRGTSLLHGNRETIDALDIMRSVGVNRAVTNTVIWLFEGLQGMSDVDIATCIANAIRCHGIATPPIETGARVHPEVIQQPFEGTSVMIEEVKKQLNEDFCIMNPQQIVAGSDTATAIRAAYEPLNVATNVFELVHLDSYLAQILTLAGIKDTFSFKRDAQTNRQEEMQTLNMLAPYVDDQYIRESGMTILGDVDKIEEVSRRVDSAAAAQIKGAV